MTKDEYFAGAKRAIRMGYKHAAKDFLRSAINVRDGRHPYYDHKKERNYLPK